MYTFSIGWDVEVCPLWKESCNSWNFLTFPVSFSKAGLYGQGVRHRGSRGGKKGGGGKKGANKENSEGESSSEEEGQCS